jgi:hypothetical protein
MSNVKKIKKHNCFFYVKFYFVLNTTDIVSNLRHAFLWVFLIGFFTLTRDIIFVEM